MMLTEAQAATTLAALSAAGTLTELDAARVLAGAPVERALRPVRSWSTRLGQPELQTV
jgi:hypothetical protein